MTILHSCCCWRSVRTGSYASGIFTGVYYTLNLVASGYTYMEEKEHFKNLEKNISSDHHIINHNLTSETTMLLSQVILVSSSLGLFSTFLLFYGLLRDIKVFLIPWILCIFAFILIDFLYSISVLIVQATRHPPTAIIVTLDLFLNVFNIYALLCVISQYQEMKAGRGRSSDDQNNRVLNIQYNVHPTISSHLSTRRAVTYHETRPTPTQSPTGTAPSIAMGMGNDEPSPSNFNRGPRKSVKFPDNSAGSAHNGAGQLLDPWTIDVKSPMLLSKGAATTDTAPLIETVSDTVIQSQV